MLENNFSDYFRDYVETDGSKASIFVRFLGDVSSTSDTKDPLLIMQLRKIVNFYQKSSQEATKASGVQSAKFKRFEALMKNYNILEEKAIVAVGGLPSKEVDEPLPEPKPEEKAPPPDERNLDDLMKDINNPKKTSVSAKTKKAPAK